MANLFFKSLITVPSIFHIPDKSMIMNYFSMLFIALSNNCLIFAMPYRQCRRAARVSAANHLRSRKLKRQLPDKAFYQLTDCTLQTCKTQNDKRKTI